MSGFEWFADMDVSRWRFKHEEQLGTKPKRWLQDPDTEQLWLMKEATFNHRADGRTYAKGDDWAERVACDVAKLLELPAATVELAHGWPGPRTEIGVISRSIVDDDESLIHGNELLEEIGVQGADPHDRTGYSATQRGRG